MMRKPGFLIILILPAIFLSLPLRAGQVYFHHFNSSNGLSDNTIFSLTQDDRGYIWLGTLNGLNRFDGQGFTLYKPVPGAEGSISNNIITMLAPGRNGSVWAMTRFGGLNHYLADEDRFVVYPDSLMPTLARDVNSMLETPDGDVLLCIWGQLYLFNPGSGKYKKILPGVTVHSFQPAGTRDVLVRGADGLRLYDIGRLCRNADAPALLRVADEALSYTLFQNLIYFSTRRGVFQYDRQTGQTVFLFSPEAGASIKNTDITDVRYDGETFWLIAQNKLYSASRERSSYRVTRHEADPNRRGALTSEAASLLFCDQLANTWIVTFKTGVHVYNKIKNRFNYFFIPQGVNEDYADPVRVILPIDPAHVLIAFDRSGMGMAEEVNGHTGFRPLDIPNTFIRAIYKDSQGNIWIGSGHGLLLYIPERHKVVRAEERYPGIPSFRNCRVIKELTPGVVLFGGSSLISFDVKTGVSKNLLGDMIWREKLSQVRDIVLDSEGYYWLGTDDSGIIRMKASNPAEWSLIGPSTKPLRISNNKVYSIASTPGKMWVATHDGLNIIDLQTSRVQTLSEKSGLTANVIYALVPDGAGHIWASTSRGLNRIDVATLQISSYLHDFYFMDDAHVMRDDGKIYFGGYDGFISFDPMDFRQEQRVPTPNLRSFKLFDESIDTHTRIQGKQILQRPIFRTDTIVLDYTHHTFTFTFDALPALLPDLVQFRYKLDGYNDRWIYTRGQERQATLTNVPPGEYTLVVQAALSHGTWNAPPRKCAIVILPPYWKTTWFRVLTAALAISTLAALYYYRLNRIRKINLYLKQQVEEQTSLLKAQNKEILNQKDEMEAIGKKLHEADQLKLNIFTTISHEFRTPLTLILGHLDTLLGKKSQRPAHALGIIKSNAKGLLNLVNQLIEIRKSDYRPGTLQVSRFHLVDFCNTVLESFQPLARRKNIELCLFHALNDPFVWLDPAKTEHILYNLLSNAIKYTPDGGQVELILAEQKDTFSIAVKDNGIGIDPGEQPFVFDTFYRSTAPTNATGHGIGLALVRSFAGQLQGEIRLESTPGQGSTFSIILKKGHAHFPDAVMSGDPHHTALGDEYVGDLLPTTEAHDEPVAGQGASILVVEDNQQLRDYMVENLSARFRILQAAHGKEGLEALQQHMPDLIISDIMMPVMDGITFCKKVKADVLTSHIPFILLTAKADMATKIEGFELGIDDFVEKPFQINLLETRIKTLLKNREAVKRWAKDGVLNAADTLKVGEADRDFLSKVNKSVEEQMTNSDFTVERLGIELGMSRSTFYRKFKALTGMTANDYLVRKRLDKARALLEEGNLHISQICFEVGLQSPSHLRDSFRKEFNITLSDYQKQFRKPRGSNPV